VFFGEDFRDIVGVESLRPAEFPLLFVLRVLPGMSLEVVSVDGCRRKGVILVIDLGEVPLVPEKKQRVELPFFW
jgi:hypothetical protein